MLKLKEIYIGDVDAKDELIADDATSELKFLQTYSVNDFVDIDDLIYGGSFFVTGLKGTGKTALLRYAAIKSKEFNMSHKFILFKSKIKDSDREKLKKNSESILVDEGNSKIYMSDYEKIWTLFLHKTIIETISSSSQTIFKNDKIWKIYKALVLGADHGNTAIGLIKLFPRVTKGLINFVTDGAAGDEIGKILSDMDSGKVNFAFLVDMINEYFMKLTPENGKSFIFIDELELNLGSKEQYRRDIYLIRDLIVIVDEINRILATKAFPVKIMCAIRKEVIIAIDGIGKEIAKPIEDFGIDLNWYGRIGSGDESYNHQLIRMIARKIFFSEGTEGEFDCKLIISEYFPYQINNIGICEYILNRTWFRPRDITRMLRIITKKYGENIGGFKQVHFEATQKTYATGSWTEIAEELSAKYDKDIIEAVEKIFTRIKKIFTFDELYEIITKKSRFNSVIKTLTDENKLADLLFDLYRVGFIGNVNPYRFYFRGDLIFEIEEKIGVHRALWPHFSILD